MKIPQTIKRIGNILGALFLAMCCIIVGISAVKTSKLKLSEVDIFTGKVIEKGIGSKSSSVSGKANMVLDVFYLRLQGLDQVLGVYNPKRDYKKLDQTIEIGNTLKVYFKKSYKVNEINVNTFQIEKNNEILLSKDDYQFREGFAGY
ncbi:MAG: hypothetical protein EOP00_17025, partial [Pedobacter sp.]